MAKETKAPEEMTEDPTILAWTAPIHAIHKRSKLWYAVASIVIALLMFYSIWTGAWSFAVVIGLAGLSYLVIHRRGSDTETIAIHKFGVQFGNTYTSWGDVSGFWLLQGPGYVELHIERTRGFVREIVIQTGETDPRTIREVLTRFIPEFTDRREQLLDMIARFLKI